MYKQHIRISLLRQKTVRINKRRQHWISRVALTVFVWRCVWVFWRKKWASWSSAKSTHNHRESKRECREVAWFTRLPKREQAQNAEMKKMSWLNTKKLSVTHRTHTMTSDNLISLSFSFRWSIAQTFFRHYFIFCSRWRCCVYDQACCAILFVSHQIASGGYAVLFPSLIKLQIC